MIQIYHTSGPRLHSLIYREYLSMLPTDQQETMARAMGNSPDIWVGYNGVKVFALMGLIPPTLVSDKAYIWFWQTPHFAESKLACLRVSRRCVADALLRYPVLVGHCEANALHSHRWMRWLGATLGDPQGPILPFRIEA